MFAFDIFILYIKCVDHVHCPLQSLIYFPFSSQVVPFVKKTVREITQYLFSQSIWNFGDCSPFFSSPGLPEVCKTVAHNRLKTHQHQNDHVVPIVPLLRLLLVAHCSLQLRSFTLTPVKPVRPLSVSSALQLPDVWLQSGLSAGVLRQTPAETPSGRVISSSLQWPYFRIVYKVCCRRRLLSHSVSWMLSAIQASSSALFGTFCHGLLLSSQRTPLTDSLLHVPFAPKSFIDHMFPQSTKYW